MNRDEKAAVVEEIAGQLGTAQAVFAVDYRGLSVSQAAELRAKLREADASFRVVKNSLGERAADQAGVAHLKPYLVGPTALTVVRGDAALAAKTLNDTARALRGLLEFKGGIMDGTSLSAADVVSIARLPAREVLYAQFVGTIASPLVGLVRGLNGLLAGLAIQLQQIMEQGLIGGSPTHGAPASVEAAAAPAEAEAPTEPEAEAPTEPVPADPEPDTTTNEEPNASEDASDA